MRGWVIMLVSGAVVIVGAWALFGCAEVSSSSRNVTTHCTQHTIGSEGKASGAMVIEDCDISVDTKSKSTGF